MTKYYKINVVCTGKSYAANAEYETFDRFEKCFATLAEVKAYLTEQYGKCKRIKMYRDNPNNEPYQSGWIYCFNNDDICHVPVNKWRQQDWVEVTSVEETIVLPIVAEI